MALGSACSPLLASSFASSLLAAASASLATCSVVALSAGSVGALVSFWAYCKQSVTTAAANAPSNKYFAFIDYSKKSFDLTVDIIS